MIVTAVGKGRRRKQRIHHTSCINQDHFKGFLLFVTGFKLARYIFATQHSVTGKVDFGINWRKISFLAWP